MTKICANIATPGWVFNTGSTVNALGWIMSPSATQLCFTHTSGTIPIGSFQNVFKFCLSESPPNASSPTPQDIIFQWYTGNNVICTDSIETDCGVRLWPGYLPGDGQHQS
ncbi:MAG: hypothetical protein IPK94_00435 [Saprospiraceae bacterium]|nr:hypothetical protein [Saprospiraceae bacterium]